MPNHPIFAPTFHGNVTAVRKLLKDDGTLVSVRDAKNLTPVHVAASRGQHKVIKLLLQFGADVQGPTDKGEWTPIVFASYRGHFDAVKVLVENGAGVSEKDGNPIHYAGQRKHKDICRLLVEHGAIDSLIRSKNADVLALFRASYSYDSDAVREILTRRPKIVNSKDKHGRTPLHEACTHGDTKTVRELLKAGADPTIKDKAGQTPADRADAHGKRNVMKILEKYTTE